MSKQEGTAIVPPAASQATTQDGQVVESAAKDPMAELQRRLRTANAQKQKFSEARALEELRRQVEQAEREAAEVVVLEGLIEKYGEIGDKLAALHTSEGLVVVKRPAAPTFKKFQDVKDQKVIDVENLVRPCVVYPERAKFEAICDALPATLLQVADLVASLAGSGRGRVEGK